jgi:hypothetical protein
MDPRVQRADGTGDRVAHVFNLTSVDDIDDRMRAILTEAFVVAGET